MMAFHKSQSSKAAVQGKCYCCSWVLGLSSGLHVHRLAHDYRTVAVHEVRQSSCSMHTGPLCLVNQVLPFLLGTCFLVVKLQHPF